ncbi:MAG: helix-turn-helix domain-containing protein [Candidatus Aenigmatarchaeota archaeon]|nr:hypothetical protein [Candidatus Aenigmarchaeota archaeon]
MKLVSTNYLGMSIIGISIIMFVILLTISLGYARMEHALCGSPSCTLVNHIPVQAYAGFGILIVSAGIGSYLALNQPKGERTQTISKAKLNKIIKDLSEDEKKIFNELTKNDGSAFQNDLINVSGFSKVKVSRILDRLETKGLVERRRRGMSNLVLLKTE